MNDNVILRTRNLTKQYPGVLALDHLNLEIMQGEILALVGENGAGKSTLIKMLSGAIAPSDGTIEIAGKTFSKLTPSESRLNGISTIYQEFNLVAELRIYENIYLGEYPQNGPFLDRETMRRETRALFKDLGIDLDPNMKVRRLSVAYQQMVEIAKAVSKRARILIMDEPSAPLTLNEVDIMFRLVRRLNECGVTVIYISHRLEEVFEIANRVAVLRDGKLIDIMPIQDTNRSALIQKMIGRELTNIYPPKVDHSRDEVVLKLENLSGNGDRDISFEVYRGEILGLGGLVGAGRTELAEMLFGVKKPESGSIIYKGSEYTVKNPGWAIKNGIVLIPEDRKRHGVLLHLSEMWNVSIANLRNLTAICFIDRKKEKESYDKYHRLLRIKTSSPKQLVRNLSGGNQQKVVLAKWMATNPDVIIFDEPTRGIDVAAKYEIYQLILDLVESGKSVIMISSEMPELISMSDRIVILKHGTVSGVLDRSEFSQKAVMEYAI